MNNGYLENNVYTGQPIYSNNGTISNIPTTPNYSMNNELVETSFIDNILKLNNGKKVTIYLNTPNLNGDNNYDGIIEKTGNDYIILSDPKTGKWHLIPIVYINYITFDEKINYNK